MKIETEQTAPTAVLVVATILFSAIAVAAGTVAADNADNDPYASQAQFAPGQNGGYGFDSWVELEQGSVAGSNLAFPIDDGIQSWRLSGENGWGRGLSNSLASGKWTLLAKHDYDYDYDYDDSFSGFSLRTSTNIGSGFGDYEIMRFGLDPSQPGDDGTGVYVSTNAGNDYAFLDCDWIDGAGDILEYEVGWDGLGGYSLAVSNLNEGVSTNFSGQMQSGSVAMLGMAVFGNTTDDSLTADNFAVVPEPGVAVIAATGVFLLLALRRLYRIFCRTPRHRP